MKTNVPYLVLSNPGDGRAELQAVNKTGLDLKWEEKWSNGWSNVAAFFKNNRIHAVFRNSDGRIECGQFNDQKKYSTNWEDKWQNDWHSAAAAAFVNDIFIFSAARTRLELGYLDPSNKYHTVYKGYTLNEIHSSCMLQLPGKLVVLNLGSGIYNSPQEPYINGSPFAVFVLELGKFVKVFEEKWSAGWISLAALEYQGRIFYFAIKHDGKVEVGEVILKTKKIATLWTDSWSAGWKNANVAISHELVAGEIRPVMLMFCNHGSSGKIEKGSYPLYKHL